MEFVWDEILSTMVTKVIDFDVLLKIAIDKYRHTFNAEPNLACCAPGRVNLIGEHVDYNDGFVLPMALPMVTIIVGRKHADNQRQCDILTLCDGVDEPKRITFSTENLTPGHPKWANYMKGVMHNFGTPIPGFNAVVHTNVPTGGGLSSSAALEVATFRFMELLTGKEYDRLADKALVCQKAEHQFAGMPCGIMDQLISVMGQAKNALLVDCQSLETKQIPFETDDLAILICNSNVKHELSSSEYPTRRKQCNEALELMGLTSYKDAKLEHLELLKSADEILLRRARHVITEIQRTSDAAVALKSGDFVKMGQLMRASHNSLRDDFEVSCKELDILVDISNQFTLGSRMTGGGFGGCTVSLLNKSQIDNVVTEMYERYAKATGGKATFYVCEPAEGARLIDLTNYL